MLRNCLRFGAAALACFSSVVSAQQTPAPTPPATPAPAASTAPTSVAAPAPITPATTTPPATPSREAAPTSVQRASLAQCIKLAMARNLDVRSAGEDTELARAQESGVKGQFGPRLNVESTYQHYNEPYTFPGFGNVHDWNVWNVTATLTQPITGLFAIYDAYKVRDLGVDIAGVRLDAVKRQTALHVVQSYYTLLQAERLAEVAVASIEQLNAQLRQARSFHDNGTVSQDDVLRAQLAVANAEQRRIAAQARVTLERVQLAMLLGLPPNTPIEAEPIANDHPLTLDSASLEQDEKSAETQRLELREVDRRIELSDYDKRLAYAKLAPQINLVGAYIHNVGSLLAQKDSAYVGAAATWNLWDWGTTLSGISEAKARQRQALIARMKIADQIRMEVTQAYLGVGTASEAMDVAKAAVAAAEENYRLVSKRREAAVATSFDVVDAEALLTQARGQMQTALYDFVIARAALHAAMGATPDALATE